MLTDLDKQATGNREPACAKFVHMICTRRIQRKAFPIGLQPLTDNLEDLETHVPAHYSE